MAYDYSKDNLVLNIEDSDVEFEYERSVNPANLENATDAASTGAIKLFEKKETSGDVKWMAVKPWKGAIKEPSNAPRNDPSPPTQGLELTRVIGYHGWDQRSNIVINRNGHIIYPIAGTAVVLDSKTNAQRIFQGQNDDITCIAQSPVDLNLIATGQVATIVNRRATLPHICVWDSTDFKNCVVLRNAAKRAVRSVAFSADGKYLASVGGDDQHSVAVWDWKAQRKVAEIPGDTNKIYQVKWNPKDPKEFVTVGDKHVFFWTFNGSTLTKKKAMMDGKYPWQPFYSVAFSEKGYACCGGGDGSIYVFVSGTAKKVVKVHSSKVYSIDYIPGGLVSAGGNVVTLLDKTMTPTKNFSFPDRVSAVYAKGDEVLAVGTQGAEVYEIRAYADPATTALPKPIVKGHFDGELWGLAVHPSGRSYVTTGEDNRIYHWDIATHALIGQTAVSDKVGLKPKVRRAATDSLHPINQCARSVAFSPDGSNFVVGTNSGEVFVFRTSDLACIASHDLARWGKAGATKQQWIQVIKYSPSGRTVAVASHGFVIVLLDVADGYKPKAALKAHNAAVTHMDWSVDGKYLQANDMAYELLFHSIDEADLTKSKQETSATLTKDVQWATQTCILGWSVQGIFDPQQDGTDINTVDTSPSKQLVVTGDDYGNVNLFRYPVVTQSNQKKAYEGHSAHVVTTRFTPDERYVVSVGGGDKAIVVWRVTA